jgi:hypothetical protein
MTAVNVSPCTSEWPRKEQVRFAVVGADGQVADPPLAVVRASLVLAAEAGKVLIHGSISLRR